MHEGSLISGLNGTRAIVPGAQLFPAKSALEFDKTPPRMDVKFPILGFLMEAEATGYDLKQRFQDPVGFFYQSERRIDLSGAEEAWRATGW